jgi:peptide/nickel transport system substrate-binding protein
VLLLALCAIAVPLVVVTPAAAKTKAKEVVDTEATLKVTGPTCSASLDPQTANSILSEYIYDELIGINNKKELQPGLAESWTTSKDGLTITLKLRKGVSFVDGTAFNSTAVKASLERGKAKPDTTASLSNITSITATDPNVAVLNLAQPDSSLLSVLATPISGRIISPKAITANTSLALSDQGAGTTGYKVVSFTAPGANAKIIFERAPGFKYWDPKMWQVKRFEITCGVNDATTAYAGIKTGAYDYINANFATSADLKTALSGVPNVAVIPFNSKRFQHFDLNETVFPDVNVRKAIMQSLDFVTLSKSGAIPGLGCEDPVANEIVFNDEPGYVKNFKSALDYSAARQAAAKSLLTPLHLNFDVYYRSARADAQAEGEFIKQQLAAVGVTVNLKALASAQLAAAYTAGTIPAMVYAINSYADPANMLTQLYGAQQGGAQKSFSTKVKPMLDAINALPLGSKARADKLAAFNKFATDQAWVDPFCAGGSSNAAATKIHGIPDEPQQWTTQFIPRTWYVVKPA